jgi:hypothetical protein
MDKNMPIMRTSVGKNNDLKNGENGDDGLLEFFVI